MRGPIEARIAALRGQVRRLLALHGLSRLVFGLVTAVLARRPGRLAVPPGPRGPPGPPARRRRAWAPGWLIPRVFLPLVVKFADLDIALRIEDRWPGLNDRLASTVQFLRQARGDDSLRLAGPPRRHGRADPARGRGDRLPPGRRPPLDPQGRRPGRSSRWRLIGGRRRGRADPQRDRPRPPVPPIRPRPVAAGHPPDRPATETPRKIARGMPFTLAVGVAPGERLPSTARVTYRYPDGETATEPLRPTDDGTFRGRLDSVAVPFTSPSRPATT